ncbi:MAG TPA: ABC-ATPase domain-containing protein, partial [Fibrobacteraceae bacterium]|nr:ABC-ATPase domain-containing protein [Fibrobacteraceae bacterium]
MKDLYLKLSKLQGKTYGAYHDLHTRVWDVGDFRWEWVHIQGDPYAPPSRLRVSVPLETLGVPLKDMSELRRLAMADFFLRRLAFHCPAYSMETTGKKGGLLAVVEPGPEILARNSCRIESERLVALLQVGLPADGRRIESEWVTELLCQRLPAALTEALYAHNFPLVELEKFVRNLAIQHALRDALPEHGLVAFVGNGSILPRAGGNSSLPLQKARPFISPSELRVELEVLGERVAGLGIPTGITVIAGGGFHGKSTLLSALESGVYDHVPGDGRERVVCETSATKIRVEEGRRVAGSCIEPLVRRLPGGKDTRKFSTPLASGSTSQAANLMEAIGLGAKTLLIDEDASAVNFLIRDVRMRQLVHQENEPLIPLVDRIRELQAQGRNFVLVIGACGDYLQVADTVLVMENWQARVATHELPDIQMNGTSQEKESY